ncbi:MAG: CapA family protein [marine benthic group bacterium]|nr:CapA family protein [Gemmatimonadota bacterium]MCL7975998.1 CapA family protein [Gemmatimonadota bacterium]
MMSLWFDTRRRPGRAVRPRLCLGLMILPAALGHPGAAVGQETGATAQRATERVRIIAVGDVMPGTEFPDAGYLDPRLEGGAGPEAVLGDSLTRLLGSGDLVFGNMEGVLWDEDVPPSKECKDPKACYVFRSPESYAELLADAGFTVMALANNHSGDWGEEGRQATMAALSRNGIRYAGLAQSGARTASLELDAGIRVGVAAFSPNKGTLSINDPAGAAEIVRALAAQHDLVVVSFHGGAEGSKYTSLPRERETFYGENRGDVYAFAHTVVDAGADVVIGHGPHVPRAIEIYRDRFIAYSLGNFWTYGRFNLRGPNGLAPVIDLELAPDGRLLDARIHSARQEGRGGPTIDHSKGAMKLIADLTSTDVPEAGLEFGMEGQINWPGRPGLQLRTPQSPVDQKEPSTL